MANLQKWKRKQMPAVVKEATRQLSKYKNKVDPTRSHLNYTLVGGEDYKSIAQSVDKRVRDVMGTKIKAQTKANMRPLGTWIVTLPRELKGLSEEDQRRFFEVCTDFVKNRYGEENVAYAIVHNDETTPHIHFGVVPACISRKTGKMTVSAASMFDENDLKTYHDDLDAVIAREFGQAGLMRNGRTKGNYTLDEMKERERINAELKAREDAVTEREQSMEEALDRAADAWQRVKMREAIVNERELEVTNREIQVQVRERDVEVRESALKRAWSNFKAQTGEYITKFKEMLEWGLNHKIEVVDEVLANGRKYNDVVLTPVHEEFTKEQMDEINAIVTMDQATIDANALISDLEDLNQPSAYER